jgi:hypothetical protein
MSSDAYKTRLIKIYFELLKKHYDNNPYTSLESVKYDLEEELNNYRKQLLAAKKLLFEIEYFYHIQYQYPPF